ncbi:YceI family protein [Pseudoxanthomonas putridarboris]|uniref:YceI family protein n=1 Tax=Pseudoxanthomonas putridarboris TaxID=752605 RepID=A0ABU9IYN9_9GAMM
MPGLHASFRSRPRAARLAWRLWPLLALLLPVLAWADDRIAEYQLDPVHTRVMFAVEHAGFSRAIGTVSGSTGTLAFDPGDWTRARLDATVPLDRVDLGDAEWNKATLARSLLNVEQYPTAHFVSTRVEPVDAQHAAVYGTLTLHGVSREVKLDVTLNAAKRHPLPPFRRTVGFSATARISRAEFGITAWKSVIGDDVELRIEAEATYRGKTGAEAEAETETGTGTEADDDARGHDEEATAPEPTP